MDSVKAKGKKKKEEPDCNSQVASPFWLRASASKETVPSPSAKNGSPSKAGVKMEVFEEAEKPMPLRVCKVEDHGHEQHFDPSMRAPRPQPAPDSPARLKRKRKVMVARMRHSAERWGRQETVGSEEKLLEAKLEPMELCTSSAIPGMKEEAESMAGGSLEVPVDPASSLRDFQKMFRRMQLECVKEECLREASALRKNGKKRKGKKVSKRPDLKALGKILSAKAVHFAEPQVGDLPGLEVGLICHSRAEMAAIGIHRRTMNGIDFIPTSEAERFTGYSLPVATCIVLSGGYEDDVDNEDEIIYTGQGGNDLNGSRRQKGLQSMKAPNLSLKHSMEQHLPVRVFRGFPADQGPKIYTYNGLYAVVDCREEPGRSGYNVCKFKLTRLGGQAAVETEKVSFLGRKNVLAAMQEGVVCQDLSFKLENLQVTACNAVDKPPVPPRGFEYLTANRIARGIDWPKPGLGCSCHGSCTDDKKCSCASRNGGSIPYVLVDKRHRLVKAMDVVYECGPHCGCGPECINKATQNGLQYRLQVFRTKHKGWGVRTWDYIPSGAPVCEYTGELVKTSDCNGDNGYMFEIDCIRTIAGEGGRQKRPLSNYQGHMRSLESEASKPPKYTIDAGDSGSVARFVNHSCDGNLFVQCVLSAHHDLRLARVVLFAGDHILPGTELSYDYGYQHVLPGELGADEASRMKCHCGSSKCKKYFHWGAFPN